MALTKKIRKRQKGSATLTATDPDETQIYLGSLIGTAASGHDRFYQITSSLGLSTNASSGYYVGGLVGAIGNDIDIYQSRYTGNISASNVEQVGGIVGRGSYLNQLYQLYVTGDVAGKYYVGGIAGLLSYGTVYDTYVRSIDNDSADDDQKQVISGNTQVSLGNNMTFKF